MRMMTAPIETHAQRAAPHDAAGSVTGHRPRWLFPALAMGGAVAGLAVLAGVISPALAVYGALFAGCGLMHLFGHGSHGAHNGQGNNR